MRIGIVNTFRFYREFIFVFLLNDLNYFMYNFIHFEFFTL